MSVTKHLCTVAMLVALALPAAALEMTAGKSVESSRVGIAATQQLESVKAWALAVLQAQDTQIKRITNCSTQNKFWNGTTCVAPPMVGTMTNPAVAVTSVNVTGWQAYYQSRCCKKKWGVCTSEKHHHLISYCTQPALTTYTIDGPNNRVNVTATTCSPGQIQWKC